jgi:hypothetical protein
MSTRHAEGQHDARDVEGRDEDICGSDAEDGGQLRARERADHACDVHGRPGQAEGAHQVRRRNRLADERIPDYLVVGADDAGKRCDDEDPHGRQRPTQAQGHE